MSIDFTDFIMTASMEEVLLAYAPSALTVDPDLLNAFPPPFVDQVLTNKQDTYNMYMNMNLSQAAQSQQHEYETMTASRLADLAETEAALEVYTKFTAEVQKWNPPNTHFDDYKEQLLETCEENIEAYSADRIRYTELLLNSPVMTPIEWLESKRKRFARELQNVASKSMKQEAKRDDDLRLVNILKQNLQLSSSSFWDSEETVKESYMGW